MYLVFFGELWMNWMHWIVYTRSNKFCSKHSTSQLDLSLPWKQDFFSFFIFCLKWGGNAILMLRNYSFGHCCSSSDFCRILQIIYNCKILYLAPLKNYSNSISSSVLCMINHPLAFLPPTPINKMPQGGSRQVY